MDTFRDTDMHVSSGFEVESASIHVPSPASIPTEPNSWKERAMSTVDSVRDTISDKLAMIRPKVDQTMSTVRPRVRQTWQRVSMKTNDLRRNPAVLGGVAAAAGLALGLAGRWMRHRAHAPTLLIVESC